MANQISSLQKELDSLKSRLDESLESGAMTKEKKRKKFTLFASE